MSDPPGLYITPHAKERWRERADVGGSMCNEYGDILRYWREYTFKAPFPLVRKALQVQHGAKFTAHEMYDYYWDGSDLLLAVTKATRGEQKGRALITVIKLLAGQQECLEPAREQGRRV